MFFLNVATVFASDDNSETLKKITIGVCEQEGFAESNSDGSLTGYAVDYLAKLGSDAGYNIDVLLIDKGLRFENVIPSKCDLILTCDHRIKMFCLICGKGKNNANFVVWQQICQECKAEFWMSVCP